MSEKTEQHKVSRAVADLATRRTAGIFRAVIHYPDALNALRLSCYLQGLEDGYNAAKGNTDATR